MNAIKPSIIVTNIFDCVDVQKIVILTKSRVKKAGCDSVYAFKVSVCTERTQGNIFTRNPTAMSVGSWHSHNSSALFLYFCI